MGYLRADSLEEVVGLDIGYTGAAQKHHRSVTESKMEEYIKEYEHRKRERAALKKVNDAAPGSGGRGAISASSVHQESLHGNSYHGRKIITSAMIASLDVTGDTENGQRGSSSVAQDDLAESSGHDQESAVVPSAV